MKASLQQPSITMLHVSGLSLSSPDGRRVRPSPTVACVRSNGHLVMSLLCLLCHKGRNSASVPVICNGLMITFFVPSPNVLQAQAITEHLCRRRRAEGELPCLVDLSICICQLIVQEFQFFAKSIRGRKKKVTIINVGMSSIETVSPACQGGGDFPFRPPAPKGTDMFNVTSLCALPRSFFPLPPSPRSPSAARAIKIKARRRKWRGTESQSADSRQRFGRDATSSRLSGVPG